MSLAAVILAAGKGVRMESDLPKVFHKVLGKPLLQYVIETVQKLSPETICIVVGYKKEDIQEYFKDYPVKFAKQDEQLGTGHAVLQAQPCLKDFKGEILVLNGDMPLIKEATLKNLVDFHRKHKSSATVLTAKVDEPGAFGRVIRNKEGRIEKIVEKKDATPAELKINEVNTGTFCFNAEQLFKALQKVTPENAQKEYYITDTIALLKSEGQPVFAYQTGDEREAIGVNTKDELKSLEQDMARG
ncbi:MAG: NTP transferase domain-containing protein [Candidatus Margulisbacteria bacterium]|nr:NTP transferase domain-containing protein [Candidatus Margulisiibacteriota bacterium]MBU1021194.1 NTP transferase domain-containing protein [Candidatus Margulisiibacteriota bacterium]MBU1729800.1 NTP transferase domain-containing protein [Candidatus Margulisiibacteriota bacterium]MBU1955301.1 NTP transferase domain-containing protein [Candidatus Margulisiibacteriota bacterium]